MPKVSVIIPAYNSEKSISRCIDSILIQEMQDFELIIVNDGSTDKTEEVVLSYASRLGNKLKYYYKQNTGVADTRNFGMDKASGKYILFVDSDDYIDKNLLIAQEENMNKNIDIIKFKMQIVDLQGNEIKKIQGPVFDITSGQNAFNNLFSQDVLIDQLCIYLIKREYIAANNYKFVKGAYHEDFGLIPIIIANAKTVISTDFYGYYYVQSENSIMRNTDHNKTIKKMNDSFMYYDKMLNTIKKLDIDNNTKDNIKLYYTNSILIKIEELDKEDRKRFILEFKERKMSKNIKIKNVKQLIKRILLTINVNWYLKIR